MEYKIIDGFCFYKMLVNASNKLKQQKEFINSLNVFPVPDGDTGTNMSMTFSGAVEEIIGMENQSVGEISKVLAKGALMSARGNSGVILSQILRGIAKAMENAETADAQLFAKGLQEGKGSAYKAVMRPTEGTILTIIKAAGESAVNSDKIEITELLEEVCAYSEEVLNKTPEMLPVLKKAKVVDAGGMGLLTILKGMLEALKGDIILEIPKEKEEIKIKNDAALINAQTEIQFGYCTEFFIKAQVPDLTDFKGELSKLGDSMIVVGLDDIVKVHIHTNDPGVVLSKALTLGQLSKIKIDNMREQHNKILEEEYKIEETNSIEIEEKKKFAFISIASGEGISQIFKELGVDKIIEGGQTMNPSTQDILKCINEINADNIFVLPNNKNIIMAATQAKDLSNKNVVVIPTKSIPQGITCLTEFSEAVSLIENIEKMSESIKKVSTGLVTFAVRDTEFDGKAIKEGDILGIIEDKIKVVGNNPYDVCTEIIKKMVKAESELISIYYGNQCEEHKVNLLKETTEIDYKDLDVQLTNGKQPLYYFIVSVE